MRNLLFTLTLLTLISCSNNFDDLEEISPGLEWTTTIDYYDYHSDDYALVRQGMALTQDNGFLTIKENVLQKHHYTGNFNFNTTIAADKVISTDSGYLIYKSGPSKVTALNDDLSINWEYSLIYDVNYLLAVNDGYLITHSESSKVGITKLSLTGEVIWERTISEQHSQLNAIQKITDGFIAIGQKTADDVGTNIWILRLNSSGEIIWEQTHQKSETNDEAGLDIYQLDNGNFIALASNDGTNLDYDATSIMIINEEGKVIKENKLENTYYKTMIQTDDGDFIALGSGYFPRRRVPAPYSYASHYHTAVAAKINQRGERLWQLEKFIGGYDNVAHTAVKTQDNGVIVIAEGTEEYGEYYIKAFKINPEN